MQIHLIFPTLNCTSVLWVDLLSQSTKGGVCATLVHCHGEASCSGRSVDLSRSVEAHILCESFISCIGTVILCGSGACSLHCEEASSCENVVVDASFATSFRCIGNCEFIGIPDDFGEGATIPLPSTCPGHKTPVYFLSRLY